MTPGIARLILLNGPPGAGKSVLGHRYLDDHPLTLLVEVDDLRTHLGAWRTRPETRALARDLAVALIGAHLDAGHDVVVPQYLGRPDFIERLEAVAEHRGAEFVEVVLAIDATAAAARFRARRAATDRSGSHPEADVSDEDVDALTAEADARLRRIGHHRAATRTVAAGGEVEATYRSLLAALEEG